VVVLVLAGLGITGFARVSGRESPCVFTFNAG
jgi:hypothetical protein